ncbi:Cholesterol side-chain cleavage enzyme mitochondrial [Dissostichus eleginoides]|uniref:Cholesterol side-chain cleavage enzyme mitochondrial n=1 Tax=Dissostichus eleginoides TaxID=100907 RepID=A0AAD9BNY6_DISEL|nr:Cholesterol side-chain cleavage enzyme mitochondrial [Dissostichus eleginoides]
MDELFSQGFSVNKVHKMSLGRIIDKPLNAMKLSKIELTKLDSKSVEELREESISSQNITGTSQSCLNETFTVSEEQPSIYMFSPSRPCYPAARASLDASLRETGHLRFSCQEEFLRGQEGDRPQITSCLFQKPQKTFCGKLFREPTKPRLLCVPLSQLQQQRVATGSVRNLSSDSSLPSMRAPYSPKKPDEDFLKVYHKFVCQNKSGSLNGIPCRLCARSSKASISSALAALALSPHCSV